MLNIIRDAAVGTYVLGCTRMWQRALNGKKTNLTCSRVQPVKMSSTWRRLVVCSLVVAIAT